LPSSKPSKKKNGSRLRLRRREKPKRLNDAKQTKSSVVNLESGHRRGGNGRRRNDVKLRMRESDEPRKRSSTEQMKTQGGEQQPMHAEQARSMNRPQLLRQLLQQQSEQLPRQLLQQQSELRQRPRSNFAQVHPDLARCHRQPKQMVSPSSSGPFNGEPPARLTFDHGPTLMPPKNRLDQ
jgi:hypothetical protein